MSSETKNVKFWDDMYRVLKWVRETDLESVGGLEIKKIAESNWVELTEKRNFFANAGADARSITGHNMLNKYGKMSAGMQDVKRHISTLKEFISEMDISRSDLFHTVEFFKLNSTEKEDIVNELSRIGYMRRQAKNSLDMLMILKDVADKHQDFFAAMNEARRKGNELKEKQEGRVYGVKKSDLARRLFEKYDV